MYWGLSEKGRRLVRQDEHGTFRVEFDPDFLINPCSDDNAMNYAEALQASSIDELKAVVGKLLKR